MSTWYFLEEMRSQFLVYAKMSRTVVFFTHDLDITGAEQLQFELCTLVTLYFAVPYMSCCGFYVYQPVTQLT